jgi:hypothetical protein
MTTLTRPPRKKRPPEVVRHVDELLDAYRRVQAGRRRAKTDDAAAAKRPAKPVL